MMSGTALNRRSLGRRTTGAAVDTVASLDERAAFETLFPAIKLDGQDCAEAAGGASMG